MPFFQPYTSLLLLLSHPASQYNFLNELAVLAVSVCLPLTSSSLPCCLVLLPLIPLKQLLVMTLMTPTHLSQLIFQISSSLTSAQHSTLLASARSSLFLGSLTFLNLHIKCWRPQSPVPGFLMSSLCPHPR